MSSCHWVLWFPHHIQIKTQYSHQASKNGQKGKQENNFFMNMVNSFFINKYGNAGTLE